MDSDNDDAPSIQASPKKAREKIVPFPNKLYEMLDQAETEGFQHIICWAPNGRGFLIKDPQLLEKELLPRYFKQIKYRSFLRQLQLYDFFRTCRGPKRGLCYHDLFQRGAPDLLLKMKRTKRDSSLSCSQPLMQKASSCPELDRVDLRVRHISAGEIQEDFTFTPDSGDEELKIKKKCEMNFDYPGLSSENSSLSEPTPELTSNLSPSLDLLETFPFISLQSQVQEFRASHEEKEEEVFFEGRRFHSIY